MGYFFVALKVSVSAVARFDRLPNSNQQFRRLDLYLCGFIVTKDDSSLTSRLISRQRFLCAVNVTIRFFSRGAMIYCSHTNTTRYQVRGHRTDTLVTQERKNTSRKKRKKRKKMDTTTNIPVRCSPNDEKPSRNSPQHPKESREYAPDLPTGGLGTTPLVSAQV